TRFTFILLPDRLRTPQGISMARSFACAVSTPPPAVVQVRQRSFDQQGRYVLEIEFSEAMSAGEVLSRTHILAGGRELKFTEHGDAGTGKIVRLLTDPIPAAREDSPELSVRVDPGAVCAAGPIPM